MNIVVVSPHLDDAVLDAADHIIRWKESGDRVSVVSVFTSFGRREPGKEVRRANGMGSLSLRRFEALRKEEDARAMHDLGVPHAHLGFIDAAYRGHALASVFSGIVPPEDQALVRKIAGRLGRLQHVDKALVPLGIGGHIDHLMVKQAVLTAFPGHVGYYIDYPYALRVANWKPQDLWAMVRKRPSCFPMTGRKRTVCNRYASQMPVLFSGRPNYTECILNL